MCANAEKSATNAWEKLYVELLRQAAQRGKGCGKCINGRIQFTPEGAPVMCTCDLA